jgi:hypothetical protein
MAVGSAGANDLNVVSVMNILLGLRVPLERQSYREQGPALDA